jgi:hypothetical protein
MPGQIRSVELKLVRADSQARYVADLIGAWTSRNPIGVRSELRDGRLGFRLIVNEFSEQPPVDEWGLLVGECVHNLRSALDNLAYSLARLKCDPPTRPGTIAFPIYRDKAQFEKKGRRNLDQLPDSAADLIEKIQPFQRDGSPAAGTPQDDPLALLQSINNADKHRIPSVVLIAPTEIAFSADVEFQSDEDAEANTPPDATIWAGPLQPGVILVEYRTNRPIISAKGDHEIKALVAIEIANKYVPVGGLLLNLSQYTASVVSQFHSFFL